MSLRADQAVHVYCGPTIAASEVLSIVPGANVHPPVRHGDLLRVDVCPGDTVVVIDGVFHAVQAVRHKEILDLLARGIRVVGAASMGALRAAELHRYGMIGVGLIFSEYRDGIIDADDEVAVAHTDDYRQLSEALVDIRSVVARAVTDGVLAPEEAARIVRHARSVHYTNRTWMALQQTPAADPGVSALLHRLGAWRAAHPDAERAKHADAAAALQLVADRNLPSAGTDGWVNQRWRTFYLQHWIARYRSYTADGAQVPYLAILQHQQLYDLDFPRRWRQHVMSWIAGTVLSSISAGAAHIEDRALAVANAKGLDVRQMSEAQLGYWLTEDELEDLADTEKLARILVRSVSQDPSAAIWPTSTSDAPLLLNPAVDSLAATAVALRRNVEIARSGPGRTIHNLRSDKLREHLGDRWGADPNNEGKFTAAARDRGFHRPAAAVEAARSFFLSAFFGS
jgi:hypothetical protein